ncbi:MAG TPA: alpha-amylase, partial [Arthrobacter sp.]|nr:alpha-amylase [Arthrobacter sp.]
ATVLDNGGHTATSQSQAAAVPAPILTLQKPVEGSSVEGSVELSATADPEKSSHVVSFERSVAGGDWTAVGSDDSSPVYSVVDGIASLDLADGTKLQYRATMAGPGFSVVSEPRTVFVGAAPQPDSVTVAGDLNLQMGCAEWDPACPQAMMILDPADSIWRLTVDLPAGRYQYKAALNAGEANYGTGGVLDGSSIVLDHSGGPVTFRYDNSTHILSAMYASQQPGAVAVAGSLDDELGCGGEWDPACDQAQLTLDPATLVWTLSVPELAAGTYQFKAALNRSWDVNYGADGVQNGADISYTHDGGAVTFRYDHFTHLLTAGQPPA